MKPEDNNIKKYHDTMSKIGIVIEREYMERVKG